MNLRQQLENILPSLLPNDPEQALKGTELIRLVKLKLKGEYSDASLRFHFSTLAGDPFSVLAKVEKSQGYYRRPTPDEIAYETYLHQPLLSIEQSNDDTPLDQQRKQKALALTLLYYEQTKWSAYILSGNSEDSPEGKGNPWVSPSLLLVDSPIQFDDDKISQDTGTLKTRQLLGLPPLPLQSVCVKLRATQETHHKLFFQALSSTAWTHSGELLILEPLREDSLLQSLRHLGSTYKLGITSLGLHLEDLDAMPSANNILNADEAQMELILSKLDPVVITPPQHRRQVDAFALDRILNQDESVRILMNSLQSSFSTLI